MASPFVLPDRPKILVITLRRLGDVLLTTPLIRTLRRGLGPSALHMLVFDGTEGILQGNPDIDAVLTLPARPTAGETLRLLRSIARRYDLVVSTQAGDRPTLLAFVAGRRRVGLAGDGAWWKRWLLHAAVPAEPGNHRVLELLRLAGVLGLLGRAEVVCPSGASAQAVVPRGHYAVIHATPMFRYRRWTDAGWRELAQALAARGLAVVTTGGPGAEERAYLDGLWSGIPVERLDGRLDWPGLASLMAGAEVYVGPDTSMTHLAAAAGCPTVALFGPTDPRLWGPWPEGGLADMWEAAGSIQRRGNVWLVQHALPCTPCQKEGCERHLDSRSACLDDLVASQVMAVVDEALAGRARTEAPRRGWHDGAGTAMDAAMATTTGHP